jgi:hypothetical protein
VGFSKKPIGSWQLAVGSWQLAVGKIKLTRHNKTSKLEKKTKEKNYRNISGR